MREIIYILQAAYISVYVYRQIGCRGKLAGTDTDASPNPPEGVGRRQDSPYTPQVLGYQEITNLVSIVSAIVVIVTIVVMVAIVVIVHIVVIVAIVVIAAIVEIVAGYLHDIFLTTYLVNLAVFISV